MKYFTPLLLLFSLYSSAQNANWGTGLAITVTPHTTDIDISVFDPVLNANVVENINAGNGLIYSNSDGVVVAYGSYNYMEYATYDWDLHSWRKGSLYLGSANAKILTADGIVAGYGSGNYLTYAIYDVNLDSWKTGTQYLGTLNDTIALADGIVSGYGSGNYLEYATYDAQLQSWKTGSQYLGTSNAMIANADGVVIGYGSANYLVYATYDIELQSWKEGNVYIGSSDISIGTADGIVAGYGSTNSLECAVYDFDQSSWKTSSDYIGNTGSFTLSSGTITYSGSSSSGIKGYSGSGNWNSATTTPRCKLLPYGVTNSSWVRMQCMSYGGGSFNYSCGDGHQIYRKAGWKKYNLSNSYNVDLNVANGILNSACNALVDITPGIDENSAGAFSIFPNPSSGKVQLKFSSAETGELYVINSIGKIVFRHSLNNEENIDLNLKLNGIYFIRFSGNDRSYSQKIEIVN
ncbi:MAG: T9SS type A sorting domain-containing protein [Bacteroidota bacterium]